MRKVNLKQSLKSLYAPLLGPFTLVDVPDKRFVKVDGAGAARDMRSAGAGRVSALGLLFLSATKTTLRLSKSTVRMVGLAVAIIAFPACGLVDTLETKRKIDAINELNRHCKTFEIFENPREIIIKSDEIVDSNIDRLSDPSKEAREEYSKNIFLGPYLNTFDPEEVRCIDDFRSKEGYKFSLHFIEPS